MFLQRELARKDKMQSTSSGQWFENREKNSLFGHVFRSTIEYGTSSMFTNTVYVRTSNYDLHQVHVHVHGAAVRQKYRKYVKTR